MKTRLARHSAAVSRTVNCRLYSSYRPPNITPAAYDENVRDHIIRRGLVDTSTLPDSQYALPKTDPLIANFKDLSAPFISYSDRRLASFARAIATNKRDEAWELFEVLYGENLEFLSALSLHQCSSFLKLMPYTVRNNYWDRIQIISNAIKRGGHKLTAQCYTIMILSAFRAQDHTSVHEIWNEVEASQIPKTAGLWNSYIMATCNGYIWFWNGSKKLRLKKDKVLPEPPATNDTVELFKRMIADGVQPIARSYELLVLYYAKRGDMEGLRAVLNSVWGDPNGDVAYEKINRAMVPTPDMSTLSTIIHAYGYNNKFVKGMSYVNWLVNTYDLPLAHKSAIQFWKAMLYWSFTTRNPRGETPENTFGVIWRSLYDKYNIQPTFAMFYLRLLHLQTYGRAEYIVKLIPAIWESEAVVTNKQLLASMFLRRAGKLWISKGDKKSATKAVKYWASEYPSLADARDQVLHRIATSESAHRAARKRYRLYKQRRLANNELYKKRADKEWELGQVVVSKDLFDEGARKGSIGVIVKRVKERVQKKYKKYNDKKDKEVKSELVQQNAAALSTV
jgi:hypothetical protein